MKKILILATAWKDDYWESPQKADYPSGKYTELSDWENLSGNCPLPGIGIYRKYKDKDLSNNPFVYLEIKGMSYDSSSLAPCFEFEFLEKSKIRSDEIEKKLPQENRGWFSAIDPEELINILKAMGEDPPEKWKELTKENEERIDWKDYIGKYFLDLEEKDLGNDEFEDRVAKLLTALGFKVVQQGHTCLGSYPDGIALFNNDCGIVYDCKNKRNFSPNADNVRAINQYYRDAQKKFKNKNIYPVFITKDFTKISWNKIFCLKIESLLYLLYKKLFLGVKFNLSPLEIILYKETSLEKEKIDDEWR